MSTDIVGLSKEYSQHFIERMYAYCKRLNIDPHEFMADVIANEDLDMRMRLDAAKTLAMYLQPRLKATEHTGLATLPKKIVISFQGPQDASDSNG
jgi:hypothetical protein